MHLTPLKAKYAKAENPQIVFASYQFGQSAALIIREHGETVAVASVNLAEVKTGYIAIKNYSENEGVLEWLIENKIVSEPGQYVRSGFVKIPICKLLVDKTPKTDSMNQKCPVCEGRCVDGLGCPCRFCEGKGSV